MAEFPENVRNLLNDKGVGSPGGFEPPTFQLTAEKPTSSEPVAYDRQGLPLHQDARGCGPTGVGGPGSQVPGREARAAPESRNRALVQT